MGAVTSPKTPLFQKKNILASVLPPSGVFSSGELIKKVETKGLTYDAARQNVRRAKSDDGLWCSDKLRLASNETLFAHSTFVDSPAFLPAVVEKLAVKNMRPGLARCLKMLMHKEVILVSQVARLIGSPVDAAVQRTYPSLEDEIKALLELPTVKRSGDNGPLDRLVVDKMGDPKREKVLAQHAMVRQYLEDSLMDILRHHFAIQNIIAWRNIDRPDSKVFNNYPFSGFSFSYLRPLLRMQGPDARPKPTPMVFDVYSGTIGIEVVESFIERIARAGYNKTRGFVILGVIAAQDFYPDAWSAAKRAGLICINLTQMFGPQAFEVLVSAEKILSQLPLENATVTDEQVDAFSVLVRDTKSNPWFTELRGLAFETATAVILGAMGWQNVTMDVVVPADSKGEGTLRQVDVTGSRNGGTEVVIIECKGETADKELDAAYVRKFFTETVPAYMKTYRERNPGEVWSVKAEIWTTGVIGDEARKELVSIPLKKLITPALCDLKTISASISPAYGPIKRLLSVVSMNGLADSSSPSIELSPALTPPAPKTAPALLTAAAKLRQEIMSQTD